MNTTTAPALAIGDRFLTNSTRPFTENGVKGIHKTTVLAEVTKVGDIGFDYVVTEVVSETDRPSFAGTPTGGSMAWFGYDAAVARGDVRRAYTVGTEVVFTEDSPQYAANKGLVYVVESSPSGQAVSVDNTHDDGPRFYQWLVLAEDAEKAPSRQRRRTGYVAALIPA